MRRFFLPSKQTSFNFRSAFIFSVSLADTDFNLAADRPAQHEASALRDEGETFTGSFTFDSETLFSCVNSDLWRRTHEYELLYIYQCPPSWCLTNPDSPSLHCSSTPLTGCRYLLTLLRMAEYLQFPPAPPTALLLPMSSCLPHYEAYPPPHSTISS